MTVSLQERVQSVYLGDGRFETRTVAATPPPLGRVAIAVAFTGLCGTDLHIFHGHMDQRVRWQTCWSSRRWWPCTTDAGAELDAGRRDLAASLGLRVLDSRDDVVAAAPLQHRNTDITRNGEST